MFALLTAHRRRWLVFLSLSFVRALTVVALILALVAEFMTLAENLHHRALDRRGAVDGEGRYFEDSDVPLLSGGTVGFALAHILTALFLIAAAIAELFLPPPLHLYTQQIWDVAFKPFGEDCGVIVLGLGMLWIACFELARDVTGYVRVAMWMLFVLGNVNVVLGVLLRSSINYFRSYSYIIDLVDAADADDGRTTLSPTFDLPLPATAHLPSGPSFFPIALPPFLRRFKSDKATAPSTRSASVDAESFGAERGGVPPPPRPERTPEMGQLWSPRSVSVSLAWEERSGLGPMERVGA